MSEPCGKCGAAEDEPHGWQDDDCPLPIHRNHSRRLDGALICTWCVDRHRDWLTEIVELFVTLPLVLESLTIADEAEKGKPSKQPEAPAPCRLEILSLMNPDRINGKVTAKDENQEPLRNPDGSFKFQAAYLGSHLPDVPDVIGTAAAALYEALYDGEPPDYRLADGAAFLSANALQAAQQPSIDDYDAELGWCRRHLMHAHGMKDRPHFTKEQRTEYPRLICPTLDKASGKECGGALLPDKAWLELHCTRCERVFHEGDELRRLGNMLAS